MYPGSRKNALEHLECAWENGFTLLTVGCPIIIGDGLKGTDDIAVPVAGGEYIKEAKIGRAVMDADVFISLTHFKGHEMTGFGGTIKNIGMGCGSRAGKTDQHSSGKPHVKEKLCRGCRRCQKECANGGLVFDEASRKMHVDAEHCVGCGRCLGACNFDAIEFDNNAANELLNCRMAEYTKAVVDGRPNFHISLVVDVSPNCDCHGEMTYRSFQILVCLLLSIRWHSIRPVWTPVWPLLRCRAASLQNILLIRISTITMTISQIPHQNLSGKAAWHTRRRSVWEAGSMN